MKINSVLSFVFLLLLFSCAEKEFSNKVEIEIIPQFAQLSSDSTVNFKLKNMDTSDMEILCFKFYNGTPRKLYFLTDSFSNKMTSFNSQFFLDGREGSDISCNFGKQIRRFLPPRDSAFGYILDDKSSREYDSTVIEFLFYDVVDDAEYGYKIKR